jgi:hypothetical protein
MQASNVECLSRTGANCTAEPPQRNRGQVWRRFRAVIIPLLVLAGAGCQVAPPQQKIENTEHASEDLAATEQQIRIRSAPWWSRCPGSLSNRPIGSWRGPAGGGVHRAEHCVCGGRDCAWTPGQTGTDRARTVGGGVYLRVIAWTGLCQRVEPSGFTSASDPARAALFQCGGGTGPTGVHCRGACGDGGRTTIARADALLELARCALLHRLTGHVLGDSTHLFVLSSDADKSI